MIQLSTLSNAKSEENPDLDVSDLNITGWNVLVQPLKVDEKTKGGVYLPDAYKDDVSYLTNVCKVLKVGSLSYTQDQFKGETWCKEGDYVLIPKNTGTKILFKGHPLTLIACDRVLAVVKDPKDLDLNYNIAKI